MPLEPLATIDTRSMFRPVSSGLVNLLRSLTWDQWECSTIAGSWLVRDIVAHLTDSTLRRLSFHRDGTTPPPPSKPILSDRDFVTFINGLNAEWVAISRRLSSRVLTDIYARAAAEVADWFESQPLEGPALFPVSWAGEALSANWFDIGREFTELWHHQQQIRIAVGADNLSDSRFLRAVLGIALLGLPHAYRDLITEIGHTVVIEVTGPAGGTWSLERHADKWVLFGGEPSVVTTRVRLNEQTAWKLLFNALPSSEAPDVLQVEGRSDLVTPLLRARSVIV